MDNNNDDKEDDVDQNQYMFHFAGPYINGPWPPQKPDDYGIKAAVDADSIDAALDVLAACPPDKQAHVLQTGYFYAVYQGKKDIASLLEQLGANPHIEDELALRLATVARKREMVEVLLAKNANPNQPAQNHYRVAEYGGFYPLHEAVIEAVKVSAHDILKDLLKAGANPHVRDNLALQTAIKNKDLSAIDILCAHGLDLFAALRGIQIKEQDMGHEVQHHLHKIITRQRADFASCLRNADDPLVFLRTVWSGTGSSAWHTAINMNLVPETFGVLREKGLFLSPDDLLQHRNKDGKNVAQRLCEFGRLDALADPKLWGQNLRGFFDVVNTLTADQKRAGNLTQPLIERIKSAISSRNRDALNRWNDFGPAA